MNNKKEYEREELHKTIWKIANELRGSVDGWDFKQYVLGFLFYRFISENLTNYINELEPDDNFDYAALSDDQAEYGRIETLKEKGFYILPSELFVNVRKRAKSDKDLNVTLNNIFNNIENSAKGTDSEDDMKGLFDDIDVNSNKLGNTVNERNNKLVKLLDAVGDLPLGNYHDNTIDVFGDAYEYLMTMYASNAGKSGGEFFTPQEVGELLARITLMDKKEVNKVYDPCCGSGGLLLKFAKILGKENVKQGFFGQEINLTTYNLCRINMFLHDINYNKFNIARGDTLIDPKHWDDEPFDAIVSNPPYNIKWEGKSNPLLINDERFAPAGILAPESKADLAFTMHMLSWLSSKGTAAIVEFPTVLSRVGAEEKIRKYLIESNYVDTVIQLPSDLFFGTPIATCILVLKKNKTDNSVLFIDASNEFVRNSNKNKLSESNIDNIISLLKDRTNVENKSVVISNEEIANNKYNIAVNSYLKVSNNKCQINLLDLNNRIDNTVEKQGKSRKQLDEIIKQLESNPINKISELLNTLCPNGIQYKKLRDVCSFMNGKGHEKYIVDDGKYIVVNSKFISSDGQVVKYSNEQLVPLYTNDVLIVMSDLPNGKALAKTFLVTEDDKYTLNQRIGKLSINDENTLNVKYFSYILNRNAQLLKYDDGCNQTNLRKDDILDIMIPCPPLKVQNEIVTIFDKIIELEEELKSELFLRGKQYEYYRNKLLSFEEVSCE